MSCCSSHHTSLRTIIAAFIDVDPGPLAVISVSDPRSRTLTNLQIHTHPAPAPQAVVAGAEAKLSTIGAKAEEFSAESKKLQERAQLAYEEWTRGHQKLK